MRDEDWKWAKLDSGINFREKYDSRQGHLFQLEYVQAHQLISLRVLPNSQIRDGGMDSITITDSSNSEHKVSTRIAFDGRGNLCRRIRTDYDTGMGSPETLDMYMSEIELVRPLYESESELTKHARDQLKYHPSSKHKPFAYVFEKL